jgi:hypothetical protein
VKKVACNKAKDRLRKASDCLNSIEHIKSFAEFEQVWCDFLIAGNSIHSILEKGARSSVQCRQWFGGKKRERAGDELLSYMHQARNAEEHGLEAVTALSPGAIELGTKGELRAESISFGPDGIKVVPLPGVPIPYRIRPPRIVLKTVTDDRYGSSFPPPGTHLGRAIPNPSPIPVGKAWLAYLEALVREAETKV